MVNAVRRIGWVTDDRLNLLHWSDHDVVFYRACYDEGYRVIDCFDRMSSNHRDIIDAHWNALINKESSEHILKDAKGTEWKLSVGRVADGGVVVTGVSGTGDLERFATGDEVRNVVWGDEYFRDHYDLKELKADAQNHLLAAECLLSGLPPANYQENVRRLIRSLEEFATTNPDWPA